MPVCRLVTCFFFNDTATTEIYTLSLHDALPIYPDDHLPADVPAWPAHHHRLRHHDDGRLPHGRLRSEEHTSELQSRGHLVCRLLLEKKKRRVTGACIWTYLWSSFLITCSRGLT